MVVLQRTILEEMTTVIPESLECVCIMIKLPSTTCYPLIFKSYIFGIWSSTYFETELISHNTETFYRFISVYS